MKIVRSVLAASLVLCATAPVEAHHSFAAQYDANKPVTLKGTVTKVEWTNPHARFYIDVKDADGKVVNWNLEIASPNYLKRAGLVEHFLETGRRGDRRRFAGAQRRQHGEREHRHVRRRHSRLRALCGGQPLAHAHTTRGVGRARIRAQSRSPSRRRAPALRLPAAAAPTTLR